MTERPTVTTKVEVNGPELTEYGDQTLVQFIDELTELLDKIPEAHRGQATIRGSGEYNIYTYIEYERPETDEEKDNRLVREARARADNEKRDREQLAKLKARYEA